jgi:hypothetical protein
LGEKKIKNRVRERFYKFFLLKGNLFPFSSYYSWPVLLIFILHCISELMHTRCLLLTFLLLEFIMQTTANTGHNDSHQALPGGIVQLHEPMLTSHLLMCQRSDGVAMFGIQRLHQYGPNWVEAELYIHEANGRLVRKLDLDQRPVLAFAINKQNDVFVLAQSYVAIIKADAPLDYREGIADVNGGDVMVLSDNERELFVSENYIPPRIAVISLSGGSTRYITVSDDITKQVDAFFRYFRFLSLVVLADDNVLFVLKNGRDVEYLCSASAYNPPLIPAGPGQLVGKLVRTGPNSARLCPAYGTAFFGVEIGALFAVTYDYRYGWLFVTEKEHEPHVSSFHVAQLSFYEPKK